MMDKTTDEKEEGMNEIDEAIIIEEHSTVKTTVEGEVSQWKGEITKCDSKLEHIGVGRHSGEDGWKGVTFKDVIDAEKFKEVLEATIQAAKLCSQ